MNQILLKPSAKQLSEQLTFMKLQAKLASFLCLDPHAADVMTTPPSHSSVSCVDMDTWMNLQPCKFCWNWPEEGDCWETSSEGVSLNEKMKSCEPLRVTGHQDMETRFTKYLRQNLTQTVLICWTGPGFIRQHPFMSPTTSPTMRC